VRLRGIRRRDRGEEAPANHSGATIEKGSACPICLSGLQFSDVEQPIDRREKIAEGDPRFAHTACDVRRLAAGATHHAHVADQPPVDIEDAIGVLVEAPRHLRERAEGQQKAPDESSNFAPRRLMSTDVLMIGAPEQ
jgi:hypothetical protein